MRKSELIKQLQEIEGDPIVIITSNNFELNGASIEAKRARVLKGSIAREGFRDAFDGENYSTEVFKHDSNSEQEFIFIS